MYQPEKIYSYKLKEQYFIKKDNIPYTHFITYGDIFGFCYDLYQKIFYLFLNGELINIEELMIDLNKNNLFVPFLRIGCDNEIIFNSGDKLEYENIYKGYGFIPLDEYNKNNYELSNLIKVTDDYLDILVNFGQLIIGNNTINYSDINQIFHIIFYFLGKYSFQEPYI